MGEYKKLFNTLAIAATLLFCAIIVFASCSDGPPKQSKPKVEQAEAYNTADVVIQGFGTYNRGQHENKMVLVRHCNDTTMAAEIVQYDWSTGRDWFTTEQYYNWKVGDTVKLHDVPKKQFFRLKRVTHM